MTEERNAAWLRAMPVVFVGIWSTGFIVARYGMPNSPPFTFLAWRYFFSIFCFLLWIRVARVQWPQGRAQWLHLAVTGVLMHGGYLGGVWAAVKVGMGSGLSALIVGLQPVLTAVWLSSRGGHVSRRQWLGLLLGFLGLALVLARKLEGGVEVSGPCPGTRRGGRLVPVGVAPGMLNPEAGAAVGAAGEVTVCPQLGHGPLIPAMLDGTVSWVRHAPHSNWMTSNITPE